MEQIICRDVTLGYDSKAVVSGINFSVCEGDYLCIIGENGSGKSTLMKALLGLVRPLSGTIEFVGGARQSGIGYLPQQTTAPEKLPRIRPGDRAFRLSDKMRCASLLRLRRKGNCRI